MIGKGSGEFLQEKNSRIWVPEIKKTSFNSSFSGLPWEQTPNLVIQTLSSRKNSENHGIESALGLDTSCAVVCCTYVQHSEVGQQSEQAQLRGVKVKHGICVTDMGVALANLLT